MKKLVILPMIAVAALGLAACKPTQPVDNGSVSNEVSLNSEAPVEASNVIDETTLNTSVDDNATAIDNASNATVK